MLRPLVFIAVTNFTCAGQRFRVGDVVPPSVALSVALRFGERFVIVDRPRHRSIQPVAAIAETVTDQPDTPTDGDVDQPQEQKHG